jgi:prepilin peptidase CpaA
MPMVITIALILLVSIAAWSDIRTRRIPNSITVSGAVAALVLHSVYGGVHGMLQSIAGAVLGLAFFIVLYIAGGMGAGDVKLFGAVGAFAGPQALILVFVFTGLLGGIAAIALALSRGRLRETIARTGMLMADAGRLRWQDVRASAAAPEALRLPYGAVIAGGTLISLIVIAC